MQTIVSDLHHSRNLVYNYFVRDPFSILLQAEHKEKKQKDSVI